MAIPSKQIGSSQESNLLWNISKQLENLTCVTSKISGSNGTSGSSGTSGIRGDLYRTTSVTTYTLGIPGVILVEPGLGYSLAQDIIIANSLSNHQHATIISYNDLTGELVFDDIHEIVGSGTFSFWEVNLAGASGGNGSSGSSGTSGTSGITFPTASYGLYAQTAYSTAIIPASGEASLVGTGVGTLAVPANFFSIGDSFVVKMCGQLTCANNETIHIRIRSNGIVIIDAAVYTLSLSTSKFWDLILDFTIRNIGGPGVGSLASNGVFTYNKNANSNIDGIHFAQVNSVNFDTTIINSLTITAEWITLNTANTIRSQNFTLTKVY